jgi:hypothetical protein
VGTRNALPSIQNILQKDWRGKGVASAAPFSLGALAAAKVQSRLLAKLAGLQFMLDTASRTNMRKTLGDGPKSI